MVSWLLTWALCWYKPLLWVHTAAREHPFPLAPGMHVLPYFATVVSHGISRTTLSLGRQTVANESDCFFVNSWKELFGELRWCCSLVIISSDHCDRGWRRGRWWWSVLCPAVEFRGIQPAVPPHHPLLPQKPFSLALQGHSSDTNAQKPGPGAGRALVS